MIFYITMTVVAYFITYWQLAYEYLPGTILGLEHRAYIQYVCALGWLSFILAKRKKPLIVTSENVDSLVKKHPYDELIFVSN